MIGKLKGKLSEINNNIGLIETAGGVYYNVFLTPKLIGQTKIGQPTELYTYLQVRDDALVLFGFESKNEQSLFTLLLSVPGVGPKTAFGIVSHTTIDELTTAVKSNDPSYFTRIPGLGKKTAMKVILELSQKMQSEFELEKMYLSDDDKTVVDALMSLGYKSQEAKKLLQSISRELSVEEKIKEALRMTSRANKGV